MKKFLKRSAYLLACFLMLFSTCAIPSVASASEDQIVTDDTLGLLAEGNLSESSEELIGDAATSAGEVSEEVVSEPAESEFLGDSSSEANEPSLGFSDTATSAGDYETAVDETALDSTPGASATLYREGYTISGNWAYYDSSEDDSYSSYGGVVIAGYVGPTNVTSLEIPSKLDGKTVTVLAWLDSWDESSQSWVSSKLKSTLTSVTIPSTIKSIGVVFKDFSKLEKVNFPGNSQLEVIYGGAFQNTAIKEFVMPASLKKIINSGYGEAFWYCTKLERVVFNDIIEPFYWFDEHFNPFPQSPKVQFAVPSTCKNYKVANGALMSKDGTILYSAPGTISSGSFTVPAGTKTVARRSFAFHSELTSVSLPAGLELIGYEAFNNVKLTNISIPSTVKELAFGAFANCTSLQTLTIPNSVTTIGDYAISECNSLTSITIPDSVTSLGYSFAKDCLSLQTVVIGNGLKEIPMNAFNSCKNLKNLTIGSSVETIGYAAFAQCYALESVYLPASVKVLKGATFGNCTSLVKVTGGTSLERMGQSGSGLDFYNTPELKEFPLSASSTTYKFIAASTFQKSGFTPTYPAYLIKDDSGNYWVPDDMVKITGTSDYDAAKEQLELTNVERSKVGAKPLSMNIDLQKAAMQRAAEIALDFSHTRPDGSSCFSIFPSGNSTSGENIAAGYSTAQGVTNQWMNSSGHKANMLSTGFSSIGIGCFRVGSLTYWVQCFGTASNNGYAGTSKQTQTYTIYVSYDEVPFANGKSAFNMNISQSNPEPLKSGSTYSLEVGISNPGWSRVYAPTDGSSYTWSVSDGSVLSVSQTGVVTAKKPGTATVTAKSYGGYTWTKTFKVERSWTRLWGGVRYDTMSAISSAGWTKSSAVVLANGTNFPDALAASALAGANGCPVLLTEPGNLTEQTRQEIKRLGATKVYIVGGKNAVSDTVANQVKKLGCTVERLSGDMRQDTALAIANKVLQGSHSNTCIIASGTGFADALSISPYAYANKAPIYLAEGDTTVSSKTLNAIKQAGYTRVIIVGGTSVVSNKTESAIKSIGISNVGRLGGAARYETSDLIAKWAIGEGMSVTNLSVACGTDFPDALAGSAFCGKNNSVLLLADDNNTSNISGFISSNKANISQGYVFGGTKAISDNVWKKLPTS